MLDKIRLLLRALWDSFGRLPDANCLSRRLSTPRRLKTGTYRLDWTRRGDG